MERSDLAKRFFIAGWERGRAKREGESREKEKEKERERERERKIISTWREYSVYYLCASCLIVGLNQTAMCSIFCHYQESLEACED
jgi:hypothetical protein